MNKAFSTQQMKARMMGENKLQRHHRPMGAPTKLRYTIIFSYVSGKKDARAISFIFEVLNLKMGVRCLKF
ncbi:MAG: hypothetical protein ACM3SR_15870 [Ignavibacteriales bacterium]